MAKAYADIEQKLCSFEESGAKDDVVAMLLELGTAVHREGDAPAAAALLPRIVLECGENPDSDALAESLKLLIMKRYEPEDGDSLLDAVAPSPDKHAYVAIKLLAGKCLSSGEYLVVVDGLAAEQTESPESVVSVLHLLEGLGNRLMSTAMVFLSHDSGMPWLPLRRFWPHGGAFMSLPIDYATRRGALAFDRIEDTLVVGVLNPYDVALQRAVTEHVGQPCQFYLVPPADYDGALSLARESSGV
jgi:hypothetical protein